VRDVKFRTSFKCLRYFSCLKFSSSADDPSLKSGAAPRIPEGKQKNREDRVFVKREREEDPIDAIRSRKKSRKRNAPVSIDLTLD
jgi:hypothetical protein